MSHVCGGSGRVSFTTIAWGTFPVLNAAGLQCTSVEEVDRAVQQFWVDTVLRRHAQVDCMQCWEAFMKSEFFSFIPHLQWRTQLWTAARVRMVLGKLREGAAPGLPGMPIAVWKSLPECWM